MTQTPMTRTPSTRTPSEVARSFVRRRGVDALMGRYLPTLAPAFADVAGVTPGQRVLDVGCGPGGLTGELTARVGAASVAAIDPSEPFVRACRERPEGHPGVPGRCARRGHQAHLAGFASHR